MVLPPLRRGVGVQARGSYTRRKYGGLTAVIDPLNKTTAMTYDEHNDLRTITDAKSGVVTLTYDAAGNLTGWTDPLGHWTSFQYDAAGNRTAMITPENRTVSYAYDNGNLLTQITAEQGVFAFAYDAANRRTTRTLPNGTTTTYAYDEGNRLTGITTRKDGVTLDAVTYTLDDAGNRITKTEPTATYTYAYDALYRVTGMTPTGGSLPPESYTYDPVGNRLSSSHGLPLSGTLAMSYTYDRENRLTGVTLTQNGLAKEIRFAYDPFGRRIAKTLERDEIGTDCAGGTCPRTTGYVYDFQGVILEYGRAGTVTSRYVHGPAIDEPLALEKNGQTLYYHADGLGSITAITNAQGSIVQRYAYDTFGNIYANLPLTVNQPYAFTGREYDQETGMYFYRARYYDPRIGRFVTRDPIGFEGGDVNLYGYVQNNPINAIDPSGRAAFWYHFADGYRAGRSMGYGIGDSLALGWATMAPDFNANKTNPQYHATTNDILGSPRDTINSSFTLAGEQWQTGTTQGMGNAIHIWRDVASHAGSYFPDPNATAWDYTKHIVQRDLLPGGSFDSVIMQRINGQANGCGGK